MTNAQEIRDEGERLPMFVYGSLRTGEFNWEKYLKGRTLKEVPAVMPGHVMFGATYPYILAAESDQKIIGNLVYLDPANYAEIMEAVDGLEGYDPETNQGDWLRVIREAVYTDPAGQEQRVRAWVYYGNPELLHEEEAYTAIESGDWLNP